MERWKLEESEGVMVYTDAYYELEWNAPQNLSEIVVQESNQIKSATDNRGTFDGGNADITFSVTGEDYRIAREFNALEKSKPVAVDVPEAYAEDDKVARGVLKSITDELRREPVEFSDGSKATVSGRTRKEIEHHFADRRIIAAYGKMRELAKSARYIYSAENSERGKNSKQDIAGSHYYLAKGNFPERGGEAYVCISVAEFKNGDRVYDLTLTDVDEAAKNKSEADSLPATRVSRTGPTEAASLYKGRIHRIKEFVNYINAQNDNYSGSVMTGSQRREAVKNELARVAAMDKQVAVLADDWERVLGAAADAFAASVCSLRNPEGRELFPIQGKQPIV